MTSLAGLAEIPTAPDWQPRLTAVAERYNREYRGQDFDLPDEVAALPVARDWATGQLSARLASPFWELAQPSKNSRCLDLGCGASFLIYPWREWQAFFYGQDLSQVACDLLNARGPQLNSKLFKGATCKGAHDLDHWQEAQFDSVVATAVSCYLPSDYWATVLAGVRRILKPGGAFVFDVVDPELPLAEDWALLETYLGAEVLLEPGDRWAEVITAAGAKVTKQQAGEIFRLYRCTYAA